MVVMLMLCVTIVEDLTTAHVNLVTQEMAKNAQVQSATLVSLFVLIPNGISVVDMI